MDQDVEVMDAGDAFDGLDAAAQRSSDVDVAGEPLHEDMNHLTGDPGTAPEDEGGDADAHRRVYDEPAEGKHKGAADDDDDGLDGVGGDVDVGGLDVETVRGGATEDHGGGDLGDESGGGNQEHGQAFDVRGGLEAANSLEGDVAGHGPKGQAVDQGGEDLGAIVAVATDVGGEAGGVGGAVVWVWGRCYPNAGFRLRAPLN